MLAIIWCRIFCLPVCYKKCKDYDVKNCNIACWFVWVCNLVAHTEGGTWAKGFSEQGAEKNILA